MGVGVVRPYAIPLSSHDDGIYCYNPSKLLGGYRYRPLGRGGVGWGGVKRSGTMHPKSLFSRPVFGEKRADVKGICVCDPQSQAILMEIVTILRNCLVGIVVNSAGLSAV